MNMESCVSGKKIENFNITQLTSECPVVTALTNFLADDEAEYLIQLANDDFEKSMVMDPVTGQNVPSQSRTSTTAFLGHQKNDKVLQCLEKKIATIAGYPLNTMESLQVTRYQEGQKYDHHYDYFDSPVVTNDRAKTVFAYLQGLDKVPGNESADKCGGFTSFPKLKDHNGEMLRVRPKTGNAVMWDNMTWDGKKQPLALHGGDQVTCDGAVKYGLNAWFRKQPFDGDPNNVIYPEGGERQPERQPTHHQGCRAQQQPTQQPTQCGGQQQPTQCGGQQQPTQYGGQQRNQCGGGR